MFPLRKVILCIVLPMAAVFFLEHGGWIAYSADDAGHAPIEYGILHIVLLVLAVWFLHLRYFRGDHDAMYTEIGRLRRMMPRRASMVMWILAGTLNALLVFLCCVLFFRYLAHREGNHFPFASFLVLFWGGGQISGLLTMDVHVRLMRWYIGDVAREAS